MLVDFAWQSDVALARYQINSSRDSMSLRSRDIPITLETVTTGESASGASAGHQQSFSFVRDAWLRCSDVSGEIGFRAATAFIVHVWSYLQLIRQNPFTALTLVLDPSFSLSLSFPLSVFSSWVSATAHAFTSQFSLPRIRPSVRPSARPSARPKH